MENRADKLNGNPVDLIELLNGIISIKIVNKDGTEDIVYLRNSKERDIC